MHSLKIPRLSAALMYLLLAVPQSTKASEPDEAPQVVRPLLPDPQGIFGQVQQSPQTVCNPTWIGHTGSTYLTVGVGGIWNFESGFAGTDTTQGWRRWVLPYRLDPTRPPQVRPEWSLDYGNNVNNGNSNLRGSRFSAGRKFVQSGVAGVWHRDHMVGVKRNVNDGAEPSSLPISGAFSAWCGLRESGNSLFQDAWTGNYLNADLQLEEHGLENRAEFPGYGNQWDQMLYKDFPSTGSGTIEFTYRTDLSTARDPFKSGWFDPDPTLINNFVNDPADSFMVYVGSPNESAYDTNRRWLSEVIDFGKPCTELFRVSGTHANTHEVLFYSGEAPVGGVIRVVFRVKTNRVESDETTNQPNGFNSKEGAALIDEVSVNGGTAEGFEAPGSITARSLIPNLAALGGPWATTGKPPSGTFHVTNRSSLLYEDVNAPNPQCDLSSNVLVAGDDDNGEAIPIETYQAFESPAVDLSVRSAAPGTINGQGITQADANRPNLLIRYDWYSGFMDVDESVFWNAGLRFHGPTSTSPVSGKRQWSPILAQPFVYSNPFPICLTEVDDLSMLGAPIGDIDSLRVLLLVQTQGWRWGGLNLGNTRGTYFDNIAVGLYDPTMALLCPWPSRAPETQSALPLGPPVGIANYARWQDTFPWNESVAPGDNAAFDTTKGNIVTGQNIVVPTFDPGVVPGDTMVVASSDVPGDGVTSGIRMDLVFRIDPGPGSYSIKGNRSSALIESDPAHPFWATYKANNGPFGTPGGHGALWNREVWNSCRMDTAEINLYPIVSRGLTIPTPDLWMSAIHEADPNFTTLGITHNRCFLIDPAGENVASNTICDGTVPPGYPVASPVAKEGTKILPDGYFTPGTHIEYFVRSSRIESPGNFTLFFDTLEVFPHAFGPYEDRDAERFSHVDVLPDMWKSTRYGGAGLACMLLVDGADRRGSNRAYRGAADSLGYGKNNGASQGWKRSISDLVNPNDPSQFVAHNGGQYGLNYDQFDMSGSESWGAGRIGSRFATNAGAIALKISKAGPSATMLTSLYTSILVATGDLDEATLHDGIDAGEGSRDVTLLKGFLDGATPSNRRNLWLAGNGIMEDAYNSDDGTVLYPFLFDYFGTDLGATNYVTASGNLTNPAALQTLAPWAHPGEYLGFDNRPAFSMDVLAVVPSVDGASAAADYPHVGAGPWTASVYRPTGVARDYRTLLDGFDLVHVRGISSTPGNTTFLSVSDNGRLRWFDDVLTNHFQICARKGPLIAVGDLPGETGTAFQAAVLPAAPNPAVPGNRILFRYTLDRPRTVKLKIWTAGGRHVATVSAVGQAGPNTLEWDRRTADGASCAAGIYFYGLEADGSPLPGKDPKLVLLGR